MTPKKFDVKNLRDDLLLHTRYKLPRLDPGHRIKLWNIQISHHFENTDFYPVFRDYLENNIAPPPKILHIRYQR